MIVYDNLLDRPFVWGVSDCLTLLRDFFQQNFGIEITDYARPTNWSSDQLDLISICYEREGFEMITDWTAKDLRPADVLCLAINESKPNHFAIFVGDNLMIHHLYGRNSAAVTYRDYWRSATCYLLRHPDVPNLQPVLPDIDIGSLLRARHPVQA